MPVNVAPLFTIKLSIDVVALTVTLWLPVVAMVAVSFIPGTTPPTQVEVELHVPPVVVEVMFLENADIDRISRSAKNMFFISE